MTPEGFSCGWPDELLTERAESAIPPEVDARWYAGEGPMPCAWLGWAVAAAQYRAEDEPFRLEEERRLPKGEREPEGPDYPQDDDEDAILVREMTTITTMAYRATPEQGRAVHTFRAARLASHRQRRPNGWARAPIVVEPGDFPPVGQPHPNHYTVGLGWLAAEMRRRNVDGAA